MSILPRVPEAMPHSPDAHPSGPSDSSNATTLVDTSAGDPASFAGADIPTADTTFTGVADLFAQFARTDGDCVVVAPASASQFRALSNERDRRGRKLRLFYLAQHRIIIVTIPGYEHEIMHNHLNNELYRIIRNMGNEWLNSGAQTFKHHNSVSSGEADSNGRPFPARTGKKAWPTIVFEAGFSQPLSSLRAKMRFWFAASNHDVKAVLLLKAYPEDSHRRILLEQWAERLTSVPRQGATTTRQAAQPMLQPACIQTIIAWAGPVAFGQATVAQRRDPSHYNVTRGPLRLAFESLLLRPPNQPQEHDIVFADDMLRKYATMVWSAS